MAEKIMITGKAEIKITASQLRDKSVENQKMRGPKQIGQLKSNLVVNLGLLTRDELKERTEAAKKILATGKVPAAAKAGTAKTANATVAKHKEKIKELEGLVKEQVEKLSSSTDVIMGHEDRVKELEEEVKSLTKPPPKKKPAAKKK